MQPGFAGDTTHFVTEESDATALQSLTPPFRLFRKRDFGGCDAGEGTDGSVKAQGLGYYVTHTATACAQACIEFDAQLNSDGTKRTQCNAVAYSPRLGDTPPVEFVLPNGLYSKWNCWLKVIRNICPTTESEPWPLWSIPSDGNDLMIRQSTRECAHELLH